MSYIINDFGVAIYNNYLPYGRLRTTNQGNPLLFITLAEAKSQLRIDSSYTGDDTYIEALIAIAVSIVEKETSIAITADQQMTYIADGFLPVIDLGLNGHEVESVKYYNTDNVLTTLVVDTDYYVSNLNFPMASIRLYNTTDNDWPDTYDKPDSVEVKFKAGINNQNDIPNGLRQAIFLIIGRYYEMRQDVITGTVVNKIPLGAQHIINQYKLATI